MDYSTVFLWTLIVSVCIHVLSLARKRASCNGKLPPGPIPLPIIGNLLKIGSKPNESFAQLAKTYGPLMTLKLGSATTIVVSSSIMAKEVLQKNDQSFAGRVVPASFDGIGSYKSSSIVGSPPTTHWRKLRTICNTQMFTTARLAANQGLRRKKVQDLVSHMHENCLAGQPADIGQATFTTSLNLICNTVFSIDLVDPNSDSAQEFKDIVWEIMKESGRPNLADYFPVLKPIEFAHHDLRPVLTDLFIAGSETSSTTVEWAMAELLRNPDSMAKARLELKKTIGSEQQVKESDIPISHIYKPL